MPSGLHIRTQCKYAGVPSYYTTLIVACGDLLHLPYPDDTISTFIVTSSLSVDTSSITHPSTGIIETGVGNDDIGPVAARILTCSAPLASMPVGIAVLVVVGCC